MIARRAWLLGGVTGAAVLGGWALRHLQSVSIEDSGLWAARFPRPEGGELVMAELRGRALLLNFWAPWCAPCVEEMPELDRFQRDFGPRGWQVIGLAIDGEAAVRDFLGRVPVRFPVGIAGFGGTELLRRLGNDAGALPYTVVVESDGDIRKRKLGRTTYREMASWAA